MHTLPRLALLLILATIAGCQTTWVRLDNSAVDDADLQAAQRACNVAEKLDSLEQAEAHKNTRLARAKTNEANMLAKEDFALEERAIYAEIDACMQQQGLKKSN